MQLQSRPAGSMATPNVNIQTSALLVEGDMNRLIARRICCRVGCVVSDSCDKVLHIGGEAAQVQSAQHAEKIA